MSTLKFTLTKPTKYSQADLDRIRSKGKYDQILDIIQDLKKGETRNITFEDPKITSSACGSLATAIRRMNKGAAKGNELVVKFKIEGKTLKAYRVQ